MQTAKDMIDANYGRDLERFSAMTMLETKADICRRARKIVARIHGAEPATPHGFRDPDAFMASCIARSEREAAYKAVVAGLFEKEGF